MVSSATGASHRILHTISQRISATSPAQLPHLVPILASELLQCRDILSSSEVQLKSSSPETSVLLHKYKTQLSTLLQEKRVEKRWAAAVLIKTTVQLGGWEILQSAGHWTRNLIALLGV